MKVWEAYICLDCDEIYKGNQCPSCASRSRAPVRIWIGAITDNSIISREVTENAIQKQGSVQEVPSTGR